MQLGIGMRKGIGLAKRIQHWHERISLFASLALVNVVVHTFCVCPQVRGSIRIEQPDKRQDWRRTWKRRQFFQHGISSDVVVCTDAI
jgi:hypothetical protein